MSNIDIKTSIQDLKDRITSLKTWKKGHERAPHKPLLVLLSLANIQQGRERMILYEELEGPLKDLLRVFHNKTANASYPFYYLQNDQIWEVSSKESRHERNVPNISALISNEYKGGFTEEVYELLKNNDSLLIQLVDHTLEHYFPSGLHPEILDLIGLSMDTKSGDRNRDRNFRDEVLNAYGWKCSICEFDMGVGGKPFGLDAAHIHWWCENGPDEVTNGLALCANHHRAFDFGAFTVSEDHIVLVSGKLHGGLLFQQYMGNHNGSAIRLPHSSSMYPSEKRLRWHKNNVFKGPAVEIP